jgi:hypothetical protein
MELGPDQQGTTSRRSFLLTGAAAGAATAGAGLVAKGSPAFARKKHNKRHKAHKADNENGRLTRGDAAILRFLAAAEILETDLWQQYNELAGIQDSEVPGGTGNPAYTEAVAVLDEDMDQYIHDNTDDEFSHFTFLNAYLSAHGAQTVNLDKFRTLPSSQATGAQQIGRLTNLMQLTVDTSFWTRYRSDSQNPDFGDTLPQSVPGLAVGQHPAIPRSDDDLSPPDHLQAIANTAGFHFAHRARRHQPLPLARPAGRAQGGAAHPAQHRRQRDDALPGLARQSRQRAPTDRPDDRPGVPRPQRRRGTHPDQPDHARADNLPRSQVPDLLDHPPH